MASTGGRRQERLRFLAQEYLAAHPGPDELAPNVSLHNSLRRFLKGATYSKEILDDLIENTVYRLASMHEADYLREQLGLDCPSIFDTNALEIIHNKSSHSQLFSRTWTLLVNREIITKPFRISRFYSKPLRYLTLVLVTFARSWDMIEEWVDVMAAKKKGWYRFIYKVWLGNRVGSDEAIGVMDHAYAAVEAIKKIAH
ncbi:uncharacterized protein N7473_004978 [Penicillium subrubescens]|uniref:Uncharacterized protein n=1 Tax=Penicillium subrubescens TaxID=1316194 RepID=A0A1Q5UHZ5_9EURO|nr:uncharacterized protein N7473_004978 [Penicillium subrubescens]KAJ5900908.1 hypothetical protein N7473_004978 [Penicillium subrubescens]OKP12084.1 hypothetical protein PENSUB_2442 [Penicillium subrubescens]